MAFIKTLSGILTTEHVALFQKPEPEMRWNPETKEHEPTGVWLIFATLSNGAGIVLFRGTEEEMNAQFEALEFVTQAYAIDPAEIAKAREEAAKERTRSIATLQSVADLLSSKKGNTVQ